MKYFRMILVIKRKLFFVCLDSNCFNVRVSIKLLCVVEKLSFFFGEEGWVGGRIFMENGVFFVVLYFVFFC